MIDEYEIVTPARTGASVHAVSHAAPNKTLCGKDPAYWQWLSGPLQRGRVIAVSDVSCLVCKNNISRCNSIAGVQDI